MALLAEGDPLFYSSYMHTHTRLTERFNAVIVPGVTSVSAPSAATGAPLVQGDDVLTILPSTPAHRGTGAPPGPTQTRPSYSSGPVLPPGAGRPAGDRTAG